MGAALSISVAVPVLAGMIGGISTSHEVKGWYKKLKKPSWNPPNWIFAPMWTALYTAMGVASWMVWKEGGFAKQALPLGLYTGQLILNFMWTPLFFGKHKMGLALADIIGMNLGIAGCIATFRPVSVVASNLMIPYQMWVAFATLLNYNLWSNNPPSLGGRGKKDVGKH